MDRYDAFVQRRINRIEKDKQSPSVYVVDVTYDQIPALLQSSTFSNLKNHPVHFIVRDEDVVETREKCLLRYSFLKTIDEFPHASYDFCLSDSSLPAYIAFMASMNWKHEKSTKYHLTMDRHPARTKNIPIENASGKLCIIEEKLLDFSDQRLKLCSKKIDASVLEDTFRLKQFINQYLNLLDRNYHTSSLTDFDKAYLAYHYLFDHNSSNIGFQPLGITFANQRTKKDSQGVQRLKPSMTRWESRPVGTLDHRSGVCTGQSRLYTSLLTNPDVGIPAESVGGKIPSGEIHCWTEFLIKDKLYQCCTTMKGLFANLDYYGYVPAKSEFFAKLYPHGFLYYNQIEDIKKHIKQLKK